MAINPIRVLKSRLSAAIDWRVREEFKTEQAVIESVAISVAEVSQVTTDRLDAISALIEDLDRRVKDLEQRR